MQYIIACRVSGGVTGTRESVLKADGAIRYFETREEAQTEAARMNREMNGPYARASFSYWVEEAF